MIVWINGPFGEGKNRTAELIREREPAWRLFDPEWVGYMLRANLAGPDVHDFQDILPWRALVPSVAHEIAVVDTARLAAADAASLILRSMGAWR